MIDWLGADASLWAIPVASAIISIGSLIYVAIGVRRSADADHVDHLEQELAIQDRRLSECETDRKQLRVEISRMAQREVELMRMIVNLQAERS